MRWLVLAALAALAFASGAGAQEAPTAPVYDERGRLVETPFAPVGEQAGLTERRATNVFLAHDKVADWLERYPREGRSVDATYASTDGTWTVHVWWREAGEIARGKVDDDASAVLEAWTGPQVAWTMARGLDGAFGGKELNDPLIWVALSLAFFFGLANLRRPLSLRNLDLLALLSFGVSLAFFNAGDIFTSVPLAYPPLLYLLARMVSIGLRGRRGPPVRHVWPVWALTAATVFLVGFRIGLNVETSNVIDVGYAGVIGAQRIAAGEAPYGHMPEEANLKRCGPENAEGQVRDRVQTNGRCETANENGDTYGPVSYLAYLPGYLIFGWSGKWDDLPAAHFTSLLWDGLALLGLALVGWRFGRARLAATLTFAWAAFPFTQYVSNANTNDTIQPALLIWGFWLVSSPVARGAFLALGSWTKLSALILAPLWASYPDALGRPRAKAVFVSAFVLASLAAFWVLLLEPSPFHAADVFWERTFDAQLDRESPFSLWDWGQYHASGIPDLAFVQKVLIGVVAAAGVASFFIPRRKSPLQLAALTAALLLGFELVLTHWFYLYIPWFLPFVAFAILAPAQATGPSQPPEPESEAPGVSERQRIAAIGVGALALFLVAWLLLHQGFWSRSAITDVPLYERYGEAMVRGLVPYRDFAVEYPPGALPVFALPTAGEGTDGYRHVFELLMWLCGAGALAAMLVALRALGRRLGSLAAALLFAALAPLLLGSVVLSRFDLLPAALTAAALAALLTGRERVGCAALGLGAAAKVYPAVLLPLALAYVWRRRGRREALLGAGAFAGVVAAFVLPFALVAPGGLWDSFSVHATRGLQIESLGASVMLAAHQVAGLDLTVVSSSGSQNLSGGAADVLAALQTLLQLSAVVAIWVAFARGPADRERLVRYSAAALCAFVALGKVLSPQFLIWLLPIVPLVRGRRGAAASALLGASALLTQLWFPSRYWDLADDLAAAPSWFALMRNLVLLALVAVLVSPRREAAAARVASDSAPSPGGNRGAVPSHVPPARPQTQGVNRVTTSSGSG